MNASKVKAYLAKVAFIFILFAGYVFLIKPMRNKIVKDVVYTSFASQISHQTYTLQISGGHTSGVDITNEKTHKVYSYSITFGLYFGLTCAALILLGAGPVYYFVLSAIHLVLGILIYAFFYLGFAHGVFWFGIGAFFLSVIVPFSSLGCIPVFFVVSDKGS